MAETTVRSVDLFRWPIHARYLPQRLSDEIVLFRVFRDTSSSSSSGVGQLSILVSRDDNVYQLVVAEGGESGRPAGTEKIEELCGRRVVGLAGGDGVILALTGDGDVFSRGRNDNGQLGLGTGTCHSGHFRRISYFSSRGVVVRRISCANAHALALADDGTVYCWGTNYVGECGFPTPPAGGGGGGGGAGGGGHHPEAAYNLYLPNPLQDLPLEGGRRVIDVTTSLDSSFVLTDSGEVYAFGNNESGELGIGVDAAAVTTPTRVSTDEGVRIRKLASIVFTTLALSDAGRLYLWGLYERDYGLEIEPTPSDRRISRPALIKNIPPALDIAAVNSEELFCVLTEDGVYSWGDDKANFRLEFDRRADNLALAFAGRPSPSVAIS